MQRLEVSGSVRLICRSLGFKGLNVQERRHLKDVGADGSVTLGAVEHCAPPRAIFD